MTDARPRHAAPGHHTTAGTGAATTTPVLTVTALTKTYRRGREDVHALRGVDLTIAAGEVVVLLGRSGSGKTTLLNCVAGWETPDTGTTTLTRPEPAHDNDRPPVGTRTPWQDIAVVPQRFGLLEELTLAENVALPARLAHLEDHDRRARDLLADLGIDHLADRLPTEVSLGEAQRTTIARALVVRPVLVLADEPTGRLDEALSTDVLTVIRDRCHHDRTAVLMASHDTIATQHADHVITLHDGHVTPQ